MSDVLAEKPMKRRPLGKRHHLFGDLELIQRELKAQATSAARKERLLAPPSRDAEATKR